MRFFMRNAAMLIVTVALLATPGWSQSDEAGYFCTTKTIEGKWMFATEVGQQSLFPAPIDGDITAIGTMNIDSDGDLEGVFDATVADFGFLPGNVYSGAVVVNPDCTGALTFVTSAGTSRTDSIAIVGNGSQILAMSRDPLNLWTYKVLRLSGRR